MHRTIARFLAVAATARGLAVPGDKAAPPAPPGEKNAQVWVCSNKWCRERGAALACYGPEVGQLTARLWQECSTLLQLGNAEIILSANGR